MARDAHGRGFRALAGRARRRSQRPRSLPPGGGRSRRGRGPADWRARPRSSRSRPGSRGSPGWCARSSPPPTSASARAMSAFTIAFQVPNLVRSLFADAAIQAAFVPVFTEQLEQRQAREAFRLATNLLFLVTLVLGALTALFILVAPVLMPLFVPGVRAGDRGPDRQPLAGAVPDPDPARRLRDGRRRSSTATTASASSRSRPFFWNVAIIVVLVGLAPAFPKDDQIYAYAIGVLVGTADPARDVPLVDLQQHAVRDPPGVLTALIGTELAAGASRRRRPPGAAADAAGDDQPRADQLQPADQQHRRLPRLRAGRRPRSTRRSASTCCRRGSSRSRSTTVLFPTLARFAARGDLDSLRSTMANGMRLILLLLIPAAAAILVLSEPMIRLVYQRGEFGAGATDLVSTALFWFAFSLPFNGLFLLLTRTFFSLQRPWVPTAISAGNLALTTAVAAFALYGPSGSAGSSPRRRSRPRRASSPRRSSCAASSAGSSSAGLPGPRPGCCSPRPRSPR